MALPAHTAIMSYSSILGLVFALFAASAQAKITNYCVLRESDGSLVDDASNLSSGRTVARKWVGEPNTRGSMTIVTTCLITLGLCVWTSIHVNVQINQLPFYRLRHKVKTSLTALLFPNLVVQRAHDEWAEMTRLYEALANVQHIHETTKEAARKEAPVEKSEKDSMAHLESAPAERPSLKKWFKRCIGMLPKDPKANPNYPFSKEVCFFVVMNGFIRREVSEKKDKKGRPLPNIITPEDFFNAYARNPDILPTLINEKEILDKGNASNIAKLIILAQVTKMVLQMIGRKAMGLSVAVLELHIFVHILIAGLLYSYWWYKQLDVNEPMELDIGERYWAPDRMWSYYSEEALQITGWFKRFRQRYRPLQRFGIQYPGKVSADDKTKRPIRILHWHQAVKQIDAMRFKGPTGALPPADLLDALNSPTSRIDQDQEQLRNQVPTGEAKPDLITSLARRTGSSSPSSSPSAPKNYALVPRSGRAPIPKSLDAVAKFERNRRAMWFYIVYAGLHATVWEYWHFPSPREKWVWRGACIGVGGVPVLVVVLEYLKTLWKRRHEDKPYATGTPDTAEKGGKTGEHEKEEKEKTVKRKRKRSTLKRLFTLKGLLELVYLVASIALLGESFAILRAEDIRTYEIKSWTAELPGGS